MNITEAYIERILEIQNDPRVTENEMRTFKVSHEKREWFYDWRMPRTTDLIFYDAFRFYASFDGAVHSLYRVEYCLNCSIGELQITENQPDFKILETVFNQLIERNKQ